MLFQWFFPFPLFMLVALLQLGLFCLFGIVLIWSIVHAVRQFPRLKLKAFLPATINVMRSTTTRALFNFLASPRRRLVKPDFTAESLTWSSLNQRGFESLRPEEGTDYLSTCSKSDRPS